MGEDLGRHEQQFTGRGGAGNFIIKNPIPAENLPRAYQQKPIAGHFAGRGGAGNFKSQAVQKETPGVVPAPPLSPKMTTTAVYKGGRGGAGNIEAVQSNEKNKEDRELEEIIRVHSELRHGGLPQNPAETPILRVD